MSTIDTSCLTQHHWNILDIISFSENGIADFGDAGFISLALDQIGQTEHPQDNEMREMVSIGLVKRVSGDKYRMTRLGKKVNES